jgi:hypothetical protein
MKYVPNNKLVFIKRFPGPGRKITTLKYDKDNHYCSHFSS